MSQLLSPEDRHPGCRQRQPNRLPSPRVFAGPAERLRKLAQGHAMADFLAFAPASPTPSRPCSTAAAPPPRRMKPSSAAAASTACRPSTPTAHAPADWTAVLHDLATAVVPHARPASRTPSRPSPISRGASPPSPAPSCAATRPLNPIRLALAPLIGASLQVLWTAAALGLAASDIPAGFEGGQCPPAARPPVMASCASATPATACATHLQPVRLRMARHPHQVRALPEHPRHRLPGPRGASSDPPAVRGRNLPRLPGQPPDRLDGNRPAVDAFADDLATLALDMLCRRRSRLPPRRPQPLPVPPVNRAPGKTPATKNQDEPHDGVHGPWHHVRQQLAGPANTAYRALPEPRPPARRRPALVDRHGRAEPPDAPRNPRRRPPGDRQRPAGAQLRRPARQRQARLAARAASAAQAVFNLSGTVLHTNLGRAVLPRRSHRRDGRAARAPCALEYDVDSRRRGDRDDVVNELLQELTGAEAATVVNNNAAAVFFCSSTPSPSARRSSSPGASWSRSAAPSGADIMQRAGARLVEVGCATAATPAISNRHRPRTGLLMKVPPATTPSKASPPASTRPNSPASPTPTACRFVEDLSSGTSPTSPAGAAPRTRQPKPSPAAPTSSPSPATSCSAAPGRHPGRPPPTSSADQRTPQARPAGRQITLAALEGRAAPLPRPDRLPERLATLRSSPPRDAMLAPGRRLRTPIAQALAGWPSRSR